MSNQSVVYRITDSVTGKMYIGSKRIWPGPGIYFGTLRARKRKVEEQRAWLDAVKTRPETFVFELLFSANWSDITTADLYAEEYRLQKQYNVVLSDKYINAGYANYRFCNVGLECSESTRLKLSKSSKGRRHSDEAKRKISLAATNISEATRTKRSETLTGHKHSDETKRKISESKKKFFAARRLAKTI